MKYKTIENLVSRKTTSTSNTNGLPDHLFRFHHDSNTTSSSFAQFYQIMAALEDEDLQKHGFVWVSHRVRNFPTLPSIWIVWKNARSFTYLPFRKRGVHICALGYSSYTGAFQRSSRHFLEKEARFRTRLHTGKSYVCYL
jgi:hypothetical protein